MVTSSANADKSTSTYDSYLLQGELNIPLQVLLPQALTLGAEWNRQELDDPSTFDRTQSARHIAQLGVGCTLVLYGRDDHGLVHGRQYRVEPQMVPDARAAPGPSLINSAPTGARA